MFTSTLSGHPLQQKSFQFNPFWEQNSEGFIKKDVIVCSYNELEKISTKLYANYYTQILLFVDLELIILYILIHYSILTHLIIIVPYCKP